MSKSKMDMKSMTAWVKSRWSLVAFVVVAVLLVPAMVYFAMGMTAAKHEAFQKTVTDDATVFTSPNIKYNLPPVLASEPATETTHAPNEQLNKEYGAALTLQQESAGGLVAEAVKLNKGDGDRLHKQLIDGPPPLFPDKAGDVLLAKQFRRIYVKDAMTALLALINAKDPLSAAQLAQVLRDNEANFLQRELGTDAPKGRAGLPEDKAKTLDKEMVQLRINQYRLWGQKLSVYAGMGIFTLPAVVEADTPTPVQLWDWQMQYWTMQDILRSVADANASARDQGVIKSVVKRIEHLTVDPDTALTPNPSGGMDPNLPVPGVLAAPADGGLDYSRSITGRKSGPLYDVHTATLVCVLSTENMPAFFDTLSQSNLMTITNVKLTKVDLLADLKDGYYYGSEGVTRAEITLEAIWLRDWTKELMPKEVRVILGLEAGDPGAAPVPGAPNGTPAPAPPSGRRAGGAAGG